MHKKAVIANPVHWLVLESLKGKDQSQDLGTSSDYQQKGQKRKVQDEKQGAAEVPSMGEQASGSIKKQKSHGKKLNCSIYSMIAREFDKVLEE